MSTVDDESSGGGRSSNAGMVSGTRNSGNIGLMSGTRTSSFVSSSAGTARSSVVNGRASAVGMFSTVKRDSAAKQDGPNWKKLKAEFMEEMRYLSKLRHPCVTTVMGKIVLGKLSQECAFLFHLTL